MSKPLLPIGISEFPRLREEGCWYADKSRLIIELVTQPTQAILLPRPRRFGKTLAMSMLQTWFEPTQEDRSPWFEDLEVWQAGEQVRGHFGQHPVISLSFKDVKESGWERCLDGIRRVVANEVARHEIMGSSLSDRERKHVAALVDRGAPLDDLQAALGDLSRWLQAHHRQSVVILIDEYDTPIHAGFAHGYYDEVVGFFRNFLSVGYKGNPHLYRGCLTGILRVAKEGLFSGLNNVSDYGILEPRYSSCFGLTEPEVTGLMDDLGVPERMEDVRRWYNGYLFGDGLTIYNPWSVLRFAADLPEYPEPYWKNTSGNDVLRRLLMDRAVLEAGDMETLLGGGSVWKIVDEHVELRGAYARPDAAWSLLLFSGYLNAVQTRQESDGRLSRRLEIPNREVRLAFADAIDEWIQGGLGGATLDAMLTAMLEGDARTFEHILGRIARDVLSYHDVPRDSSEHVFHLFLLGMLVRLAPRYRVRSNREAGYGRADILISPAQGEGPGVVLELKATWGTDPQQILDEALAQIEDRRYVAEAQAEGVAEVRVYAAALDGKRVWVRQGQA